MTRARQSLAGPPPHAGLRNFPRKTLSTNRTIYRTHTDGNGAWWFSNSMDGRFDLLAPEGTCYLAETITAAVRERWGRRLNSRNTITAVLADATVVSRLKVPSPRRLADLCSGRAAQFGVTREIHTVTRRVYALTHQWSSALRRRGFEGIRYEARHATGGADHAFALFGSGSGSGADAGWPDDPAPMSGRAAADIAGIRIAPLPRTITARGLKPPP